MFGDDLDLVRRRRGMLVAVVGLLTWSSRIRVVDSVCDCLGHCIDSVRLDLPAIRFLLYSDP